MNGQAEIANAKEAHPLVQKVRRRLRRLTTKFGCQPRPVYSNELPRYGEKGAERIPFEETVNGKLVASQLGEIKERCSAGISEDLISQQVRKAHEEWYSGTRGSVKKYTPENDKILEDSRAYLDLPVYTKPSLYPLVWELAAGFKRKVAEVYGEKLPEELTYEDIDPRKAIERFFVEDKKKKLGEEAESRDNSGVTTRSQHLLKQQLQSDYNPIEQRRSPSIQFVRETSYAPSRRVRDRLKLYHRQTIMMARKRGAQCGLCPSKTIEGTNPPQSELIGPFAKKDGSMSLFVHNLCAIWAPEVYMDESGNFRHVFEAYNRGRKLNCSACGQKGATIGCYVESCRKTYHYCCLSAGKTRLVEDHFVCFCPKHRSRAESSIFRQIITAASAAALARADIKMESTYGLDTAHSVFTGLRRGEMEIIFSLALGVTTIPNVEHVEDSICSLKRRTLVKKADRLRLRDGLRVVKHSVFDIASDTIALKGNKVKRHSSLMPPQDQRVLMLRNFRTCRPFAPGAIQFLDTRRMPEKEVVKPNEGGTVEQAESAEVAKAANSMLPEDGGSKGPVRELAPMDETSNDSVPLSTLKRRNMASRELTDQARNTGEEAQTNAAWIATRDASSGAANLMGNEAKSKIGRRSSSGGHQNEEELLQPMDIGQSVDQDETMAETHRPGATDRNELSRAEPESVMAEKSNENYLPQRELTNAVVETKDKDVVVESKDKNDLVERKDGNELEANDMIGIEDKNSSAATKDKNEPSSGNGPVPEVPATPAVVSSPVSGWLIFFCESLEMELAADAEITKFPLYRRNIASLWSRMGGEKREVFEQRAIELDRKGVDKTQYVAQHGLEYFFRDDRSSPPHGAGETTKKSPKKSPKRTRSGRRKFYSIYREIT